MLVADWVNSSRRGMWPFVVGEGLDRVGVGRQNEAVGLWV